MKRRISTGEERRSDLNIVLGLRSEIICDQCNWPY